MMRDGCGAVTTRRAQVKTDELARHIMPKVCGSHRDSGGQ
jgi:hypothetical protein